MRRDSCCQTTGPYPSRSPPPRDASSPGIVCHRPERSSHPVEQLRRTNRRGVSAGAQDPILDHKKGTCLAGRCLKVAPPRGAFFRGNLSREPKNGWKTDAASLFGAGIRPFRLETAPAMGACFWFAVSVDGRLPSRIQLCAAPILASPRLRKQSGLSGADPRRYKPARISPFRFYDVS